MGNRVPVTGARVEGTRGAFQAVAEVVADVELPAPGPCDRCGVELVGRDYAVRVGSRAAHGWCVACAVELVAGTGALVPREALALAAHALGAREWATRYASDAGRTRVGMGGPVGEIIAAWRRELLSSAAIDRFSTRTWLCPVWWTEPLEPRDASEVRAMRAELAAAFGVDPSDVEVRR